MAVLDYMSVAHSVGFQRRVHYTMFDVAKDTLGGTPSVNETAYINAIVNGKAPVLEMCVGVLLNAAVKTAVDGEGEPSGNTVTDAQIKTAVQNVFTIYADAWAVV